MNDQAEPPVAHEVHNDPLDEAYRVLSKAPGYDNLKLQLWKRIWARGALNEWSSKLSANPGFARALHKAIPDDDVELLEEIKSLAADTGDNAGRYYIIGLVNERLDRCRQKSTFAARIAAGSPWLEQGQYQGYLCTQVRQVNGKWSEQSLAPAESMRLPPKSKCQLGVWVQPDNPGAGWADQLLINGSAEQNMVSLGFEIDCATLRFGYGRKRVYFSRRAVSEKVVFEFATPDKAGNHVVFVHAFQDTRLVKSMMIVFDVEGARAWKRFASKSR